MSKGTPSFGRHNKITHIRCRRCGGHSYHVRKKKCSRCGYPDSKIRSFKWATKKTIGNRKRKK